MIYYEMIPDLMDGKGLDEPGRALMEDLVRLNTFKTWSEASKDVFVQSAELRAFVHNVTKYTNEYRLVQDPKRDMFVVVRKKNEPI